MILGLRNREAIRRISPDLEDELDIILASISDSFSKEHDSQGHHTDIRVNSIRARTLAEANAAGVTPSAANILTANGFSIPSAATVPVAWTPTDASGAGLIFTNTVGNCWYVKIGRVVIAWWLLTFPATASGANATISGLPIAPMTCPNNAFGCARQYSTEATLSSLIMLSGTGSQNIQPLTAAGANITNVTLTGDTFSGTLVYLSAS